MKEEWAEISIKTWKNNFKYGWEWDDDRFGINFIVHPRTGNDYFNIARTMVIVFGAPILLLLSAVLNGNCLVKIQDHQKMILSIHR